MLGQEPAPARRRKQKERPRYARKAQEALLDSINCQPALSYCYSELEAPPRCDRMASAHSRPMRKIRLRSAASARGGGKGRRHVDTMQHERPLRRLSEAPSRGPSRAREIARKENERVWSVSRSVRLPDHWHTNHVQASSRRNHFCSKSNALPRTSLLREN